MIGNWLHVGNSQSWVDSDPGVNFWAWHVEIERDELAWCYRVMVELCARKKEVGMMMWMMWDHMSGCEKSELQSGWFRLEYLPSVIFLTSVGLCPAELGMVHWLVHTIVLSPRFSSWYPESPLISLFLFHNSTITGEYKVKSSLSLSLCHNHEFTPCTDSTKDWLSPTPSQFHLSADMLYSTFYILMITS